MPEQAADLVQRAAALYLVGVPLDLAVTLAELHLTVDDIARARRDAGHPLRPLVLGLTPRTRRGRRWARRQGLRL